MPAAATSAGGDEPVLSLRDVSFTYLEGEKPALSHFDLQVPQGDFLGIIGPSGAGKTTLAAVLSGAIPHHYRGTFQGVAMVCGMDTVEVELTDVSRAVGSVLQDIDAQMISSNVEDEMLYGLENFGVPHAEIPDRLEWALRTVGIQDLLHREVSTLSGGQKQKVAIAAILAIRPRVMVLDEPTAALDPASSRSVFETLRLLNEEEGITVVVIEQKVALLSEYCRHMAVLAEGSLRFHGTPREVFAHGEELRALGVDSPRVTRVSNQLARYGLTPTNEVCLNVEEAVETVARVVGDRGAGFEVARRTVSEEPPVGRPVLNFDHVGFSYGMGGASVEDLTFQVRHGELVGVIGQNGAGKTTTTKLINGLLRPSRGTVEVCGEKTTSQRTSQIARHVSTLFQDPDRQLCKNTVLEEVAFSLQLLGVADDVATERARSVVSRFALPEDAAPFSLSRGQRQIVALASVVVTEPDVLVLDEPTSGLDYRECMEVMAAVDEMRRKGCGVVMVCHDMEVVSDFASRLIVMANGRILADGAPADVFGDEELLARAYVSAPQVAQLSKRLADEVSPAFGGITEVHDIVEVTRGLARQ